MYNFLMSPFIKVNFINHFIMCSFKMCLLCYYVLITIFSRYLILYNKLYNSIVFVFFFFLFFFGGGGGGAGNVKYLLVSMFY